MAIKSKLLLFTIIIIVPLIDFSLCDDIKKIIYEKSSPMMNLKNIYMQVGTRQLGSAGAFRPRLR